MKKPSISSLYSEKSEWKNGSLLTKVKDGGKIAFYCERKSVSIFCGGEKSEYSYDSYSGLLCVYSSKKGAVDIKIDLKNDDMLC